MTYALRYRWWVVLSGVALAAFAVHGATVTLASDHDPTGVWIGSTVGIVLTDGLAIGAGTLLHRRLPEKLLHVVASLLFLTFALWMLFDNALGWRWVAVAVTIAVAAAAAAAATAHLLRRRRTGPASARTPPGRRLPCRSPDRWCPGADRSGLWVFFTTDSKGCTKSAWISRRLRCDRPARPDRSPLTLRKRPPATSQQWLDSADNL